MPLIETLRGPVTLSVGARDQLLDWIKRLEGGRPVARAFKSAGLGEPVELNHDGKRLVVEAIKLRLSDAEVDPQLRKLWEYLLDELAAEE